MPFYDRDDELRALEDRWDRRQSELFVIWGRRRVGKTELLVKFLEGKRGIHFEATEGLEPDHLADLSILLADATARRLLAEQPLSNWRAALAAFEEFAAESAIVILDEFQWVARATADIGSELNRWWRQTGRNLPLFLILSGSEVSFFEREVLTGTMFGRRTGQLQLRPFEYDAAALFFPAYTPEDKIRAFAVCGGMPYYLEQFDTRRSVGDNILRAILYRDGVLHEEARLLLHEELPEPARYASILRAIQNGANRFNEIVQRTGLDAPVVDSSLKLLQSLYLVRRRFPVTVANPDRTRQTFYEITDGYLRFYYRFVRPYLSRLTTNAGAERHLKETVLPHLDAFVSKPAFEEICREYARRAEQGAAAGSWWGQVREGQRSSVREVDVVVVDDDGRVPALGSCKWTNGVLGIREHALLTRLAPHVPRLADDLHYYFFSREGFDDALERLAASTDSIRLVRPQDLLP
jgi:hypothetical protein